MGVLCARIKRTLVGKDGDAKKGRLDIYKDRKEKLENRK